jgi:hypothetical protein
VTCIRIEDAKGSSEAVKLAGKHVIPFLLQRGYIKSFEKNRREQKVIINKTELVNKSPQTNTPGNTVAVADTANAPANKIEILKFGLLIEQVHKTKFREQHKAISELSCSIYLRKEASPRM